MKSKNSSRDSNNHQGGKTTQKQSQGKAKQKKQPKGQYGSGTGARKPFKLRKASPRQMEPLKKVEKEVLQYIVGQDQ